MWAVITRLGRKNTMELQRQVVLVEITIITTPDRLHNQSLSSKSHARRRIKISQILSQHQQKHQQVLHNCKLSIHSSSISIRYSSIPVITHPRAIFFQKVLIPVLPRLISCINSSSSINITRAAQLLCQRLWWSDSKRSIRRIPIQAQSNSFLQKVVPKIPPLRSSLVTRHLLRLPYLMVVAMFHRF